MKPNTHSPYFKAAVLCFLLFAIELVIYGWYRVANPLQNSSLYVPIAIGLLLLGLVGLFYFKATGKQQTLTNLLLAFFVPILISLPLLAVAYSLLTVLPAYNTLNEDLKNASDSSEARDRLRKTYAARFAIELFYAHAIEKKQISLDQAGFDSFTQSGSEKAPVDPLTKQPYVFNSDQSTMQPGEAIFRLHASCDDKIEGSNGSGYIVDASEKSIAVALKLESDKFACESNL